MPKLATDLLNDDMLARFDERAPIYDRENRFFDEDWEELESSGYLLGPVPSEFGGSGLMLDDYVRLQQRLAYVAPATALAVNMHCYWTGVAVRPVAARATTRAAGCSSAPWQATCSRACTARRATTCRCCSPWRRRPRRRRLGDLRPQDLREPHTRVDPAAASTPWTRPIPPTRRSCTASCHATPTGSRSSTRGTRSGCGPPRARTPCSTGRSCRTTSSRSCARPDSPAPDSFQV